MLKKNQKGVIHVVIIGLIVVIVIAGITAVVVLNNDDGDLTVDQSSSSTPSNPLDNPDQTSDDYPDLYKQYNLPEYPNGEITYDGRTADNLRDGISLEVQTQDDVQTVGAFYANAFASLSGWAYEPPNFSNDTLYGATATKADEGLRYQLTVTKLPDYTQINISFLEQ